MSQQETAALLYAAPQLPAQSVLAPAVGASSSLACNLDSSGDSLSSSSVSSAADPFSRALSTLRALTQSLLSPIRVGASNIADVLDVSSDDKRLIEQLPLLVGTWRLPALPLNPGARQLSLDDSLLRYELAWIVLSCMRETGVANSESVLNTALRFEEMLDATHSIGTWRVSPFTGLIQAIEIARVTGNISETESEAAIKGAFASTNRDDAWRILRATVQNVAAGRGFPR